MKKIIEKYSLLFILVLATFLRVLHIGTKDFWYDEAFTGIAVKEKFSDMMSMIIKDVHPPLYYFSAKSFSFFFDYSIYGIRLYSAIFGILGVWAVYLFTKELFNKKAALWSSFLVAISPFAIHYSQEARMYSMLGFLILISSYFFIKALKSDRIVYYGLWGLFMGLAFLTHYMGIVFAPIFYFIYLVWKFSKRDAIHERNIFNLIKKLIPDKNIIFGYLLSFIIFASWIPTFIRHLKSGSNLSWVAPVKLSDLFTNLQIYLFGDWPGEMSSGMPFPREIHWISSSLVLIFVTIFIISISVFLIRRLKSKSLIVLISAVGFMLIVYFLSLAGMHYFVARYLIAASYFMFILIGVWLAEIKLKYAYTFAFFYIFLLIITINPPYSTGYNQLSNNISKYKNNNFYSLNSFDYVISKYYLGESRLTLFNIDWPQYNPSGWAAVGTSLKRTENFDELKNDQKGLIIYNTEDPWEARSDKSFSPSNFELMVRYDNIWLYRSNSFKDK